MAKFEHHRYAGLVLQDDKGVWARFTPEERRFGEHRIKVGVLEIDDPKVIQRLRQSKDENLVEVGGAKGGSKKGQGKGRNGQAKGGEDQGDVGDDTGGEADGPGSADSGDQSQG